MFIKGPIMLIFRFMCILCLYCDMSPCFNVQMVFYLSHTACATAVPQASRRGSHRFKTKLALFTARLCALPTVVVSKEQIAYHVNAA